MRYALPAALLGAAIVSAACSHGSPAPQLAVRPTPAAPPVPRHLLDDNVPHPDYPPDLFLTAAGESSAGRAEADDAARVGLVKKINARLQASSQSTEKETTVGGASEQQSLRLENLAVQAEFTHGELVAIVERRAAGGRFFSYAALDRRRAGQTLSAEYGLQARELRALAEAASAPGVDLRTFTGLYARARTLARTLLPLGTEWAAVDPAGAQTLASDQRLVAQLNARRAQLLASHPIRVELVGGAPELAARFTRALAQLGLPIAAPQGPALPLRVTVDERFPRGIAICCSIAFGLALDGTELTSGQEPVTGCHPRDRGSARADALRQLDDPRFVAGLKTGLSTLLPIAD